ncbi:hypothetical protein AB0J52_11920, partial [Spirillospora sp. NPDC049652]
MDHGPARIPAATAVLRRALAQRAVRRLLVLAGLVVAGWLVGGAAQASADTSGTAAPQGVAVSGPGALLHASGGIVRDASAALRGRAPVPSALAVVPRADTVVPLRIPPIRPVPSVVTPRPAPTPSPAHETPGRARAVTNTSGKVRPSVVAALERHGRKAAAAPRMSTRRAAAVAVARGHGSVRRGVSRTTWHAPNAPAAPVPAPAQAAGSSAPAAGPVLLGGTGGGELRCKVVGEGGN